MHAIIVTRIKTLDMLHKNNQTGLQKADIKVNDSAECRAAQAQTMKIL